MNSFSTRPEPYTLGSVRSALRVLALVNQRESVSVSEVADTLGIGRSTAHRLLATLKSEGFVCQQGTSKRYRPGIVLSRVTGKAINLEPYFSSMRQVMRQLVETVNETSHLVVLEESMVKFIVDEECGRLVRVTSRIPRTLPAHSASSGKVLLSGLSNEQISGLYPEGRLPRVTPATHYQLPELMTEIELVRLRGYATNLGESEKDVTAIAVPVRDPSSRIIAALSVAAPRFRCSISEPISQGSKTPSFYAPLRKAADLIEESLS